jgi:hypothetical protein
MNGGYTQLVFLAALALMVAPSARAAMQSGAASYPNMAPLDRYLMAPSSEMALALSAAPSDIARNATVLVLHRDGYQTARKGTNGFTCLVERAWMSPFDASDFWNPSVRGPICYNPPASRTVLPYTLNRTQLVLHGYSKAQMIARIDAALSAKKLLPPEPGSMSYMMSKRQDIGNPVGPWVPHLMFHAPKADGARDGVSWGADLKGSPVLLDTSHHEFPEPETIFMIPVGRWSDGTPAPPASQM